MDAALPLDILTTSSTDKKSDDSSKQSIDYNAIPSTNNTNVTTASMDYNTIPGDSTTSRTNTSTMTNLVDSLTSTTCPEQQTVATMTVSQTDISQLIARNEFLASRVAVLERECFAAQTRLKAGEARISELEVERGMFMRGQDVRSSEKEQKGGMSAGFDEESGLDQEELDRRNLLLDSLFMSNLT